MIFSLFFAISIKGKFFASEISSYENALIDSRDHSQLAGFIDSFLAVKAKKETTTYILYARPQDALGDQLRTFWKDVKDQNLNNPAVLDYPPHITLTGFFPIKNSQSENDLKSALKAALKKVGIIRIALKGDSIVQTDNLDYIPFQYSSDLHSVAKDFLSRAKVSQTYIRPKPKSTLGYHLSLRQNTDLETTINVRILEEQDIHLEIPDLELKTNWALYIYKKTGSKGKLKLVYKQDIQTH